MRWASGKQPGRIWLSHRRPLAVSCPFGNRPGDNRFRVPWTWLGKQRTGRPRGMPLSTRRKAMHAPPTGHARGGLHLRRSSKKAPHRSLRGLEVSTHQRREHDLKAEIPPLRPHLCGEASEVLARPRGQQGGKLNVLRVAGSCKCAKSRKTPF